MKKCEYLNSLKVGDKFICIIKHVFRSTFERVEFEIIKINGNIKTAKCPTDESFELSIIDGKINTFHTIEKVIKWKAN